VKASLTLFVAASVENPSFDSQMKDCLTTRPADFGSAYRHGDAFLRLVTDLCTYLGLQIRFAPIGRRYFISCLWSINAKTSVTSLTRQTISSALP